MELKDLTTLSEDGNSVNLSYSCTKVIMSFISARIHGLIKKINFQDGDVLEVERRLEGGEKVVSCIDSEGNVVVTTVYRIPIEKEKDDKEFVAADEEQGVVKEMDKEKEEEKEEEKEKEVEKEVWVAEGEARRESLVLPGGREAIALYQVLMAHTSYFYLLLENEMLSRRCCICDGLTKIFLTTSLKIRRCLGCSTYFYQILLKMICCLGGQVGETAEAGGVQEAPFPLHRCKHSETAIISLFGGRIKRLPPHIQVLSGPKWPNIS